MSRQLVDCSICCSSRNALPWNLLKLTHTRSHCIPSPRALAAPAAPSPFQVALGRRRFELSTALVSLDTQQYHFYPRSHVHSIAFFTCMQRVTSTVVHCVTVQLLHTAHIKQPTRAMVLLHSTIATTTHTVTHWTHFY